MHAFILLLLGLCPTEATNYNSWKIRPGDMVDALVEVVKVRSKVYIKKDGKYDAFTPAGQPATVTALKGNRAQLSNRGNTKPAALNTLTVVEGEWREAQVVAFVHHKNNGSNDPKGFRQIDDPKQMVQSLKRAYQKPQQIISDMKGGYFEKRPTSNE